VVIGSPYDKPHIAVNHASTDGCPKVRCRKAETIEEGAGMSDASGRATPGYGSNEASRNSTAKAVDLTLEVVPDKGGMYKVEASSFAGAGTATLRLPTVDLAMRNESIGQEIRTAAQAPELPPEIAEDVCAIGQELFNAVFVEAVLSTYKKARRAAEDAEVPLRITVSLSRAPELLSLPWEALYDDPIFLATQRNSTVVRRVSSNKPLRPVLVRGQVHVLGVIASPTDMDPLEVAEERRRVLRELEPVTSGGLAQLQWLEPATVEALQRALRQDHHVLHYVGHSGLAPSGDGFLVLERSDGSSHRVSGSLLANMIGRQTQLRLAVLNSCASAAAADGDPFSGIATKLVALGVPAVIAMQYVVGDAAAVTFGSALYRSLIQADREVDEAVADARLAVLSEGHEGDCVAPVLFMQNTGARLFDLSLIGWYTLDATTPARSPEWGRPGFLGLALSDPIERAMRLLGTEFDLYSLDDKVTRCWAFQEESRVCVEERDGSIEGLSVSIDGDNPGMLRISLPYGLLLGASTMKDTLAIERTSGPRVRRESPELLLTETWSYVCPDSGEGWQKIEFSTSTAAGREEHKHNWFSWDMDLSNRLVTSCSVRPRGSEHMGPHWEPVSPH
jgi:hypothetical protein